MPEKTFTPSRLLIYLVVSLVAVAYLVPLIVVQLQFAISAFDLVRALTNGGPGIATQLPALVVYDLMFQRSQLGRGAAAAVLMLLILLAVLLPYAAWRHVQRRQATHA